VCRGGHPGAQAPPHAPTGREGEAVASAERARRGGESGGGGRLGTGRYRAHRTGAPPTRSRARPLLSRGPPPRAALSIHKFSVCSAATGRRSQPGRPRSRCHPPVHRPWAARPSAEVGAAGPGARSRGGERAGLSQPSMAARSGDRPDRGPPSFPVRLCVARGHGAEQPRGPGGGLRRSAPLCTPLAVQQPGEGPPPTPFPGLSLPR
jgi:hypothetical protein